MAFAAGASEERKRVDNVMADYAMAPNPVAVVAGKAESYVQGGTMEHCDPP